MSGRGDSDDGGSPILLCYDGSDSAKRSIDFGGALLRGGLAIVLTVWESLGSSLLRHPARARTELGRDFKEISDDVVHDLDAGVARRAEDTAADGAERAAAAGFDARPLAVRALARATERDTVTVWRAILDMADDTDAAVLVLGARGLSTVGSVLLGSVSYGVVHHSTRPVLVVPPAGSSADP